MHVDVHALKLYCIEVWLLSTTAKPVLTPVVAFDVENTNASASPSPFESPSSMC